MTASSDRGGSKESAGSPKRDQEKKSDNKRKIFVADLIDKSTIKFGEFESILLDEDNHFDTEKMTSHRAYAFYSRGQQLSDNLIGYIFIPNKAQIASASQNLKSIYLVDPLTEKKVFLKLPYQDMLALNNNKKSHDCRIRILRLPNDKFVVIDHDCVQRYAVSSAGEAKKEGEVIKLKYFFSSNDEVLLLNNKDENFLIMKRSFLRSDKSGFNHELSLIGLGKSKQNKIIKQWDNTLFGEEASVVKVFMLINNFILIEKIQKKKSGCVNKVELHEIDFKNYTLSSGTPINTSYCWWKDAVENRNLFLYYNDGVFNIKQAVVDSKRKLDFAVLKSISLPLCNAHQGQFRFSPSGDHIFFVDKANNLHVVSVNEKYEINLYIPCQSVNDILFLNSELFCIASELNLTLYSANPNRFEKMQEMLLENLETNVNNIVADYGIFAVQKKLSEFRIMLGNTLALRSREGVGSVNESAENLLESKNKNMSTDTDVAIWEILRLRCNRQQYSDKENIEHVLKIYGHLMSDTGRNVLKNWLSNMPGENSLDPGDAKHTGSSP